MVSESQKRFNLLTVLVIRVAYSLRFGDVIFRN